MAVTHETSDIEKKGKATLFHEKVTKDALGLGTKWAALLSSFMFLVVGIVVAVLFPIILNFLLYKFVFIGAIVTDVLDAFPTLWVILGYVLTTLKVLIVIIPAALTVYYLASPTKSISCPKCGSPHRILKSAKRYICGKCESLLLLGKNVAMTPKHSACTYCDMRTPITEDYGDFFCPNCGIKRVSNSTQGDKPTTSCKKCEKSIPVDAIYCLGCDSITRNIFPTRKPLPEYDKFWKIGKDASGHFFYAKAILSSIKEALSASDNEELDKLKFFLTSFEEALMSVEVSMEETQLRPKVYKFLPELDHVYGEVLSFELRLFQSADSEKQYPKRGLQLLVEEPHIIARRRIENTLGSSLEAHGCVGKWDDELITVLTHSDKKYHVVKSYDRLREEVARFDKWELQQAAGAS